MFLAVVLLASLSKFIEFSRDFLSIQWYDSMCRIDPATSTPCLQMTVIT